MKNSPWFDAFFDPAGVLLLLSSVVSGLVAAWWLFPAGIVLWVILVIKILRDPSLQINAAIENRSELTQRFQNQFNQLQKSQVTFFNTIQSSEDEVQRNLLPINSAITRLLDQVYENCRRYSLLENHRLVSTVNQNLDQQLSDFENRLQGVTNPQERARLEQMKKTLDDKKIQQQSVLNQLDQYSEKLSMIKIQLDGLITEALQAQSTDEVTIKNAIPDIRKRIQSLANYLK